MNVKNTKKRIPAMITAAGLVGMAAVFTLALVTGCASSPKNSGSTVELKAKNVSFKSEAGNLSIKNDTTVDVVVFAGKVEKDCVLGGIKKGQERSFDLSKLPGIPNNTSLMIRVASYETYRGKARITEEDVIYTGLVAYNLGDKNYLTIYRNLDMSRESCFYASNESENYVLELRLDKPSQGDVLATLAPLETNKRIFLKPKDDGNPYAIYPTWIYIDPNTNEKTAITSKKEDRRRVNPQPDGKDAYLKPFEGPSVSTGIVYHVAFINVQNDTNSGIVFQNGPNPLKNQNGIQFTPGGKPNDVYEIPSENGDSGQKYTGLSIEFDNFSKMAIAPTTFMPGYKYELVITEMNGNYEYDIREVGKKSLVEDSRIQLFME